MGTLGCINDMLRRDKENRELRKLNKDRMKERRRFLVEKRRGVDLSNTSIEKIEEIRKKTVEKEMADNNHLFRAKMIVVICLLLLFLLLFALL